ncbi:hypothetical protein AB0F17_62535 [Nonomuraea sp. NPDC026600]|uniref:fascin domain-containing protein n=1 Tax=Nonomuraea sp. NPDC026600 TaxID=3155363 RepID=UPI0034036C21
MNLRNVFRPVMVTAVALVVTAGLSLPGAASANAARPAAALAAANTCVLKTLNTGNYLTAVGAGGRTTDVIHTDATRIGSWETFTFVDSGDRNPTRYGIRTSKGFYLTAVGGGGRVSDVIHSDATRLQAWEKFKVIVLEGNVVVLQTISGHYLTAVDGGGRVSDTVHSNATVIGSWERFLLTCGF